MNRRKTIALVAHDHRKADLIEWVEYNWENLKEHRLVCTGTTGKLVNRAFETKLREKKGVVPEILRLRSGPLGGDQQLGAMIAEGKVDLMIFLWDPMQPQPHDVDVKALTRIAVLYNLPFANNRSTADYLISSPLFESGYIPELRDYSEYIQRSVFPED